MAFDNAREKIWMLEGYLLCERLFGGFYKGNSVIGIHMPFKHEDIEAFKSERDKALLGLDLDYVRRRNNRPEIGDEVCLITLHKTRYECTSISADARQESYKFLKERNLKRSTGEELLPEGMLPG